MVVNNNNTTNENRLRSRVTLNMFHCALKYETSTNTCYYTIFNILTVMYNICMSLYIKYTYIFMYNDTYRYNIV